MTGPAAGHGEPPGDAPVPPPDEPAVAPGPDERLMLDAGRGDAAAFAALYDRWSGPVLRYLWHLGYDRDGAEDLLQETFLRVWRAAPRYEVRARFSTYLFQVAKNLWINERAKILRRPPRVSLDATTGGADGEEGDPLAARLPDGNPGPAVDAERRESARRVRAAVDALPEKLRQVFVLGALEERPYAEVAEVLGIPEGTVKSRMWAAVREVRRRLGEETA